MTAELSGTYVFEDVGYTYTGKVNLLEHMNYTFEDGKIYAIKEKVVLEKRHCCH